MTTLIFVVGKIGSGKTTVCKHLSQLGFPPISASGCLRRLYSNEVGSEPTRMALADYGKRLLHENRLDDFHAALLEAVAGRPSACIDGLRFKTSIENLSKTAVRSLNVFLSCPTPIRKLRSFPLVTDDEFDVLSSHETERAVDAISECAGLTIDTSTSLPDVFSKLEVGLANFRLV
jgi:hypothetical protein